MQKMSKKNNYKEKIIRFINKYFSFITENVNEKYTRKWKNKNTKIGSRKDRTGKFINKCRQLGTLSKTVSQK